MAARQSRWLRCLWQPCHTVTAGVNVFVLTRVAPNPLKQGRKIRPAMFELDPKLRQDTIPIGGLVLSRLLLMNDATFPWLILVPAEPDIRELHELQQGQQMQLMAEITAISRLMADIFKPDKINVAALGNIVPQLHVHLIARFRSDAAWPGPVWGKVPAKPYEKAEAEQLLDAIRSRLAVRIVRDEAV